MKFIRDLFLRFHIKISTKERITCGGIAVLSGLIAFVVTSVLGIFELFEYKTLDAKFYIRGRKDINESFYLNINNTKKAFPRHVAIVDIDEESLKEFGQWPWPRRHHANLVKSLKEKYGVKGIGFDIFFAEKDRDIENDRLLAESIRSSENVCLGSYFTFGQRAYQGSHTQNGSIKVMEERLDLSIPAKGTFLEEIKEPMDVTPPIPLLTKSTKLLGCADPHPDRDGVLRRIPLFRKYNGRLYPSLSLAMVLLAKSCSLKDVSLDEKGWIKVKDLKIPVDSQGRMYINYLGPEKTFYYARYCDAYRGGKDTEGLLNTLVLIGTSAPGLYDLKNSPFQTLMPGVEIHANAITNILTQDFLLRVSGGVIFLISIGLALLAGLISSIFRYVKATILSLLLFIGFLLLNYLLFDMNGVWIEVVRPSSVFIFSYIGSVGYRFLLEEREKGRIKGIFERYVPRDVVREILASPGELKLGGERREVTILFSDVRGFTGMSERMQPEEVVSILNECLTAMTRIIFKYQGTLDKYIGDCIMAIFGAPVPQEDHAERAVKAAIGMKEKIEELSEKWKREGKMPFRMGIGINTGYAVVGNIGSPERMEYTVIGDDVNLASRIESQTEGGQIKVSESTYNRVKEIVHARKHPLIKVKGKEKPIQVYEVLGLK